MFMHYLAVLWQVLMARFVTKALPIKGKLRELAEAHDLVSTY